LDAQARVAQWFRLGWSGVRGGFTGYVYVGSAAFYENSPEDVTKTEGRVDGKNPYDFLTFVVYLCCWFRELVSKWETAGPVS
jgi:hypothetical protein